MAEHVKELLGTYLDGELKGARLQTVEAHLETCEACRNELQELRKLAMIFEEDKANDVFTQTERFAANLTLQLPRLPERSPSQRTGALSWWLVPVGITAVWIFLQTVLLVSDAVSVFEQVGVLGSIAAWLPEGVRHTEIFSTTINLFGNQLGQGGQEVLSFLDRAYVFGRDFLTPVLWQAVIGLLYWAGMLVWFLHRNRQKAVGSKLIKT